MDGKQHAFAIETLVDEVQDEGGAHGARLIFIGYQEVAADVQLAVFFFVKTGGFFDVFVHRVIRNQQTEVLFDPAFFFRRGRLQVHPNWLKPGELL